MTLCDSTLNVKYCAICLGVAICYCKAGLKDLKSQLLFFILSGIGQSSMWKNNKFKCAGAVFREEGENLNLRMITQCASGFVQAHAYLSQQLMMLVGKQILQFMCIICLSVVSLP